MMTGTSNLKSLLRKSLIATIAMLGLTAALPSAADAAVRIRVKPRVVVAPRVVVRTAPVRTTVVVRPARPVQGKYVWVPGHYTKRPGCYRVWIAGHWRRIG